MHAARCTCSLHSAAISCQTRRHSHAAAHPSPSREPCAHANLLATHLLNGGACKTHTCCSTPHRRCPTRTLVTPPAPATPCLTAHSPNTTHKHTDGHPPAASPCSLAPSVLGLPPSDARTCGARSQCLQAGKCQAQQGSASAAALQHMHWKCHTQHCTRQHVTAAGGSNCLLPAHNGNAAVSLHSLLQHVLWHISPSS